MSAAPAVNMSVTLQITTAYNVLPYACVLKLKREKKEKRKEKNNT